MKWLVKLYDRIPEYPWAALVQGIAWIWDDCLIAPLARVYLHLKYGMSVDEYYKQFALFTLNDEEQTLSEELQAVSDALTTMASAGITIGTKPEIAPYWTVGDPHPQWYEKTGKMFRGCDVLRPVPQYESMLLSCYEAEVRCEAE